MHFCNNSSIGIIRNTDESRHRVADFKDLKFLPPSVFLLKSKNIQKNKMIPSASKNVLPIMQGQAK